ncbi:hypothetical protein ASG92_25500 [Arthrobacter sp. Soil736]|uniref:hypothetical protein n=1 Tax=Arthrobacter sp. Soil736 TaxID=1736395 RepID=UPI0006FC6247|nr:hypothetical protein [Arthrobacter sp. Soil736]KRE52406.1 hypothetical protein ASG92_25500 [Arthrobacter sp. Soil736]
MVFLTFVVGAAAPAEPPFLERLLVAAAGPAVGALLGTGLIGLLVWKVTDRVQRRRAETQLKLEVLTAAFTTAVRFYMELNRFKRLDSDSLVPDEEKKKARTALDQQYLKCRAASLVLEARLEAIFEAEDSAIDFKSPDASKFQSKVPSTVWHRIDDLQTVRYMNLTGRATAQTYKTNAMGFEEKWHSGLTEDELDKDELLIPTYRGAMKTLKELLLRTKVVKIHRRRRLNRPGNHAAGLAGRSSTGTPLSSHR